jgi:hypothetical protein
MHDVIAQRQVGVVETALPPAAARTAMCSASTRHFLFTEHR